MLTKLEVYTNRDTMLSLPIMDTTGSFRVEDISGLGPVKATIVTSKYAKVDGEQVQNVRGEMRNIVLRLGLRPDFATESYSDLRRTLYDYLMVKSSVRLRFYDTSWPTVQIEGTVETFEPVLFSKDPQCQISILCPLPDFLAVDPTVVSGVSTSSGVNTSIPYWGTVPTGFIFTVTPERNLDGFIFTCLGTEEKVFEFNRPFGYGSRAEFGTEPGSKFAQIRNLSNDLVSNALASIVTYPSWPRLDPGANLVRVDLAGAAVPWNLIYVERYGGL